MRRQRCVIGAVAEQADPVTIVTNFGDVAKALKHNLSTDIPVKELTAWGDLAMRIKDGRVKSLPFTNEVINSAQPDWDKIQDLVQKALKPPKKAATTPTTTPGTTDPTGGTGTDTSTPTITTSTKKSTKPADPTKAQDVGAVC
jgi:anionic cell wall polymer biosynthesis LytR-Cps2A-Psr (LCP) family protein